ncbi:desulfoferrodoxin family protein [Fusobacterium sp. PH5-44]|uniref:desulfoferrodoxin family protein n=1 Tax=unclassified Fusobacterium TaxID=2648384 RepID=UPI003D20C112
MNNNDMFKEKSGKLVVETVSREKISTALEEKFEKLIEKSEDATVEKHVPYIEECENGYLVKVGQNTKHPMIPEHFIEFIELLVDDNFLYRKYLKAGEEPEAFFQVAKGSKVLAREYCNIHGLWKS